MTNVLEMGIGSKKIKAVIKNIDLISVLRPNNKLQQKIVLTVVDTTTNLEYKVSDAWVDFKDQIIIRALWFFETPDGIYADSTLAKAMKFYHINNLKDFIGKTVNLFPDKNDFLTLVITPKIS
jgi:hypothetical protein